MAMMLQSLRDINYWSFHSLQDIYAFKRRRMDLPAPWFKRLVSCLSPRKQEF